MRNKKRALAVIPARGGSKRLPQKNLRELHGKPLIEYTIDAAIDCGCFETIIVSSDDEKILAIAADYGNSVIADRRPDALAGDHAKAREVLWEIVDRPEFENKYDVLAMLLPTAPHRTSEDIKNGFDLLDESIDAVNSVTEFEMTPLMGASIDPTDGLLKPIFQNSPLLTGETRSQDHAPIYRPNGAFYLSWWSSFTLNRMFFKGMVKAYVMPRGVDIDHESDLAYAEHMVKTGLLRLNTRGPAR